MPTYDYRCDSCGHTVDEFQQMSDDALILCPECEERSLRRLIGSGAGIIFKGSGFYETDYKRAGEKKPSESKPESKPEKKSSEGST